MNIVLKADEMFNDLPSRARRHFDNDPAKFLDFVQDPKNHEQLVDLGLATVQETFGEPQAEKTPPPVKKQASKKAESEPAPADT